MGTSNPPIVFRRTREDLGIGTAAARPLAVRHAARCGVTDARRASGIRTRRAPRRGNALRRQHAASALGLSESARCRHSPRCRARCTRRLQWLGDGDSDDAGAGWTQAGLAFDADDEDESSDAADCARSAWIRDRSGAGSGGSASWPTMRPIEEQDRAAASRSSNVRPNPSSYSASFATRSRPSKAGCGGAGRLP